MRVLFICTDDFPNRGACTSLLSNLFFKGNMVDRLEKLDILTVKYQWDQQEYEVFKGVGIYRVPVWSYISANEIRRNVKKRPMAAAAAILLKSCIKLQKKVRPRKYLDDVTVRQLMRGLERVNARQYDLIVAVAGDFHTVEAVRRYTRRPDSPRYFIYQVDPCSTNYIAAQASKKNRIRFEEQAYGQAALVMTTPIICNEAANHYQNRFREKFIEIEFPNVSDRYGRGAEKSSRRDDTIRCVFTGDIYRGIRDPKYTLELFRRLTDRRIEFMLVGVSNYPLPEKDSENRVLCLGARSLDETRRIIAESDVLVNIGNAMRNQVPSKLFEYISTGKPIVNIYKNPDCPTLHYLENYPYALNLFEDMKDIDTQAERLQMFILDHYGSRGDFSKINRVYLQCTPRYCADQMVRAFLCH